MKLRKIYIYFFLNQAKKHFQLCLAPLETPQCGTLILCLDFQEIVSTKKRLTSLANIPSEHESTKVTYVTLHVQHVSAKQVFKSEKRESPFQIFPQCKT